MMKEELNPQVMKIPQLKPGINLRIESVVCDITPAVSEVDFATYSVRPSIFNWFGNCPKSVFMCKS